jgi:hypothetical protein
VKIKKEDDLQEKLWVVCALFLFLADENVFYQAIH